MGRMAAKQRRLAAAAAHITGLTESAVSGAPEVRIVGAGEARITGTARLRSVSAEAVQARGDGRVFEVYGEGLTIDCLGREGMAISGRIRGVRISEEGEA